MNKKPNQSKQQDTPVVVHLDTHGDRLRYARTQRGYTQEYVASKIGIAQSMLSSYEKNTRGVNRIRLAYVIKLAMVLDVSMDWLMTGKERDMPTSVKLIPSEKKYAPILPWQDIRKWKLSSKENMNFSLIDNIPVYGIDNNNCFALRIEDSGTDGFTKGDVVVINPDRRPILGNYILVSDAMDGCIYIRTMIASDEGNLFFDSDCESKQPENQKVCYGVVVANIKKLA